MYKLRKRALPILLIALFMLSLMPALQFALGISGVSHAPTTGYYDTEVTVTGLDVTAGATVNVYWDLVKAWDGEAGLIKAGTAKPDGTFSIKFKVPEATNGLHYIWVKDMDTGQTAKSAGSFDVDAKIKFDKSSGLKDDTIMISGYGFTESGYITSVTFDYGGYAPLTLSTTPTQPPTNTLGSWTATFKVPNYVYNPYVVRAVDNATNWAEATFTIGPSITLTPKEGPSGTVVKIDGRGFLGGFLTSIVVDSTNLPPKSGVVTDVKIVSEKFSTEVVMQELTPSTTEYTVTVTDNATTSATGKFEVTGKPKVTIEPGFGAPGSTISISGLNFTKISGKDVKAYMGGIEIGTYKTTSTGTFSGTFTCPAGIPYGDTTVTITDAYDITTTKTFRVGVMVVIPVPSSGPSGKLVTLTATGFSIFGDWNATFGDEVLFDGMVASGSGTISEPFYVPTSAPGTYTITVLDIDTLIEVKADFTVTHETMIEMDPPEAPKAYNVTLMGHYFAARTANTITFTLYNSTYETELTITPTETNSSGYYEGWFIVPNIELGDYMINATDSEDMFAQTSFSVVTERIDITTRKTEYAIGDTLSFIVRNDFKYDGSYVKIWDPDGELYWQTDSFDQWLKVGAVYTVPFYSQTAGGNPMTLSSEAPQGLWSWKFYKVDDKSLASGEFEVGPSQAEALNEQMTTLSGEFDTLSTTVSSLSQQVGTISATVTQLSSTVAQAAAAAQQANAAVADLADTVSEIAGTANSAKTAADAAKTSADAARDSADQARTAATGLTTLVYGAIGASLVAALAAIVSLMQISRRIAG